MHNDKATLKNKLAVSYKLIDIHYITQGYFFYIFTHIKLLTKSSLRRFIAVSFIVTKA